MVPPLKALLALLSCSYCRAGCTPAEDCAGCLSVHVHDAPGIGFDLSLSHGLSSVRFYGGAIEDIGQVDASQECKDLMIRLSVAPKQRQTVVAKARRWLNKRLGKPSTPEVGVISEMISRLKEATEAKLARELSHVVITHPPFPALSFEDVGDAVNYAGLQSWLHNPTEPYGYETLKHLSEGRAALAATGHNICKSYKDYARCHDESMDMPLKTVFFVSLTPAALYTTLGTCGDPFASQHWPEPYLFDVRAGLLESQPGTSDYWSYVRRRLEDALHGQSSLRRSVSQVVVAGEGAALPDFKHVLQAVLRNNSMSNIAETLSPVYAPARGAALYARWRQEAPVTCVEDADCDAKREQHRGVETDAPSQKLEL